jgi:hypothetical protein
MPWDVNQPLKSQHRREVPRLVEGRLDWMPGAPR